MLEGAVSLSSPTRYSPTIEYVAKKACQSRGKNDAFYMLVILTDGEYSDDERTKAVRWISFVASTFLETTFQYR